jgi:ribokinase
MIVVIGSPALDASGDARDMPAAGLAAAVAIAAAAAGAEVQLVGRVGDDPDGDAVLLALSTRGVRHAAVIRDAGRPTRRIAAVAPDEGEPLVPVAGIDPGSAGMRPAPDGAPPATDPSAPTVDAGDLALALGYLVDPRVVVVAEALGEDAAAAVSEAGGFADAAIVAIVSDGVPVPAAFGGATVLVAPADDADGAFARLVGRFAAGLDGGASPGDAFARARGAEGWEAVGA